MTTLHPHLLTALAEECAAAIGTLTGVATRLEDAPQKEGPHWLATFVADGRVTGTCAIALEHSVVEALRTLSGRADRTLHTRVLSDLMMQAAQSATQRAGLEHITLSLLELVADAALPTGHAALVGAITSPKLATPIGIRAWSALEDNPDAATAEGGPQVLTTGNRRLDVILDIDLPVVVRFGRTELPLRSVAQLAPGSVIDLGRSPEDPVEMLVSNRVIARGEVVVVDGNYGIRILDVVSPSERMRSMVV